ncbi:hypothetical protein E1200_16540 [Actinomadura sp. GC306]|uniref:hypothetical protein n=1 Tax=Actinomadura sp. GC306 TaxID=2530367 RepID=UPI001046CE31|nr:hypothetical protein [Actinomadura sp. GC306]TDC66584.1 hypothetical protein E1200_16540 [Actinomadura sp. GC306]
MKRLLVIPAAIVLTLGMSACGSDSKDDAGAEGSPSAAVDTSVNPSGGTITGNGGGGGNGNGGGAGDGGGGDGGSNLTPAQQRSIAKVIECMRKKGYDMPEPSPDSPAIAPRNVDGMDPAKVNKDSQECAAQAAQGG